MAESSPMFEDTDSGARPESYRASPFEFADTALSTHQIMTFGEVFLVPHLPSAASPPTDIKPYEPRPSEWGERVPIESEETEGEDRQLRLDQAWFWSPAWQAMEQEAEADLAAERYDDFETMEEFITDLEKLMEE